MPEALFLSCTNYSRVSPGKRKRGLAVLYKSHRPFVSALASSCGLLQSSLSEDFAHPLERFADVLAGVRVGEAQVALAVAAESRTGEARYACLVEE